MSDPHADLAALADGSLPAGRRAEVEARVAASPELQDALARQRAAVAAVAATEADEAPPRLRAWLRALGPATAEGEDADGAATDAARRDGRGVAGRATVRIRGRPGSDETGAFAAPPWRAGSAATAGSKGASRRRTQAAARRRAGGSRASARRRRRPALVAIALAVLAGGAGASAIVLTHDDAVAAAEVVALGARAPDGRDPQLGARGGRVRLSVDGIAFPDWHRVPGWPAVGARRDRLVEQDVGTVFYRRGGETVAYSIVERPSVPEFEAAERVRRGGRTYLAGRLKGREVVLWYRNGRTCVLSGAGVSRATLLRLARYDDGSPSSRATRSRARYSRVASVGGLTSSSSAASW